MHASGRAGPHVVVLAALVVMAGCDPMLARPGAGRAALDEDAGVTDGAPCGLTHGVGVWLAGVCRVRACDAGFEDCDGDPATGCEGDLASAETCGACGRACSAPGATGSCVSGSCVIACAAGLADCDGLADTGCETSLASVWNCGACGAVCRAPGGELGCVDGACVLERCADGWLDCDADPTNGCETSQDDPAHCGSCGNACGYDGTGRPIGCASGACVPTVLACYGGTRDCTGAGTCDVETISDSSNCGSCGLVCSADRACQDAACRVAVAKAAEYGNPGGTCFLMTDGTVRCRGFAGRGENGDGVRLSEIWEFARPVAGIADAVDICAGDQIVCVVRASGAVSCWGDGSSGQLGDGIIGATHIALSPVTVPGISDARSISCSSRHVCVLLSGGTVSCWGDNFDGQLGDGTMTTRASPGAVLGLTNVAQIESASLRTCARRTDGSVWCWGEDNGLLLGAGSDTPVNTLRAAPVNGVTGATDISCGGRDCCVVRAGGLVRCWGTNYNWELGVATVRQPTPTDVRGIDAAVQVCTSGQTTCALTTSGRVQCFGENASGGVGVARVWLGTESKLLPGTYVHHIEDAARIDCGEGGGVYATRASGHTESWGHNFFAPFLQPVLP